MEQSKKKNIERGLLVALILFAALLGTVAIFARGLDANHQYAKYPDFLGLIPFAVPFPIFLLLERFFNKDGDYDFPCVRGNYPKALSLAFFVEAIALIGGTILLISFQEGGWSVLSCGILSHVGLLFFLAYMLILNIKDKENRNREDIFTLIFAFALALSGFIVGTSCAFALNIGWGLFYVSSPLSMLTLILKKGF